MLIGLGETSESILDEVWSPLMFDLDMKSQISFDLDMKSQMFDWDAASKGDLVNTASEERLAFGWKLRMSMVAVQQLRRKMESSWEGRSEKLAPR